MMSNLGHTLENNSSAGRSSLYDNMQMLPKFYSAKMFVLIEKLACINTGLASGMVAGLEGLFDKFPKADLNSGLRNSKQFKNWHRSMEDLIDESGDLLRGKLLELSDIIYSVTDDD